MLSGVLDFELIEWDNREDFTDSGERQTAVERFAGFLHGSARYTPLPLAPRGSTPRHAKRRVVLVEDLPNLAHEATRSQFHTVLEAFLEAPHTPHSAPLVLVVSDCVPRADAEAWHDIDWRMRRASQMDVRTAVPLSVRQHPAFAEIRFNPLTPRMIQSALAAQVPNVSRAVLADIAEAAGGDIRCASNTAQLISAGRACTAQHAMAIGSRESALVVFHALGKVLYNKRVGDPGLDVPESGASTSLTPKTTQLLHRFLPSEMPLQRAPRPWEKPLRPSLVDIEALCAALPVDATTFQLYLYHNFPAFTNDIDECTGILEALSVAESLYHAGETRTTAASQYAFHAAARGTLAALPSPVTRRGQKLTKPAAWDMAARARDIEAVLREARAPSTEPNVMTRARHAELAAEVLPLVARIESRRDLSSLLRWESAPGLEEAAAQDDLDAALGSPDLPPNAWPDLIWPDAGSCAYQREPDQARLPLPDRNTKFRPDLSETAAMRASGPAYAIEELEDLS